MLSNTMLKDILADIGQITGTEVTLKREDTTEQVGDSLQVAVPEDVRGDDSPQHELPADTSGDGFLRLSLPQDICAGGYVELYGAQADLAGRMLLAELAHITRITKPRQDRTSVLREILHGTISPEQYAPAARRVHLEYNVPRAIILTRVPQADMASALEIASAIFTRHTGNQIFSLRGDTFVLVRELDGADAVQDAAHMLADTLRAELLTAVRVACSTPAAHLGELRRALDEAQLALSVASVFSPDTYVVSYDHLGIGRLIYSLDAELCRTFLRETFGTRNPLDGLDADSLSLINHFFAHNLNITDTAKELFLHRNTLIYRLEKIAQLTGFDIRRFDDAMTFRIAMMVNARLKHDAGVN